VVPPPSYRIEVLRVCLSIGLKEEPVVCSVDSVKVDGCNQEHSIPADNMSLAYPAFGAWLNKTGRPMVYSCSWPE
jgi:hypothetical protein